MKASIAAGALALAGLSAAFLAQTSPRQSVPPSPRARVPRVVVRPAPRSARQDWPQFNFDSRHSGNNPAETVVSRANVSSLRRLFSVSLPDVADGAPVVLADPETRDGTRDLIFLTTKAGRLVALDAKSGAVLWIRQPAAGPRYTTSSPALDPGRQFVYSYGLEGSIHRFSVADGVEATGGGWPQLLTLKPSVEKCSSALALAQAADGRAFLYAAIGGYPGDAGDYQGHLTTINLADGSQKTFNANCSDKTVHFVENGGADNDCSHRQTAIWPRPGVMYDAATDRIYTATGNGDFDANLGGHDWGDSVFALAPDGSGAAGRPVDSYTPVNFQSLQNTDTDLGSAAPAILTAPPQSRFRALAVQAGKDSELRLLALDNLSQQGGTGRVGGELQILRTPQGSPILAQPAVWRNPADNVVWLFVATSSGICGVQLSVDAAGTPALAVRWQIGQGGSSPILANGVLYYAGNGRISALDPTTGVALWTDTQIGGIHWESPILVNGILYIADESGMLNAYSLDGRLPP